MTRSTRRGRDPQDETDFAAERLPALREAVAHLSWLLGRGYAERAALALVGDRLQLTRRQRHAVQRCACPDAAAARRAAHRVGPEALRGAEVAIDGFNVIIPLERALSGGPVLLGRDGALRDTAGVHGTWRARAPTAEVIDRVGTHLAGLGVGHVRWWLDAPVSNSGRLAGLLRDAAAARDWSWDVEVVTSTDRQLAASPGVVATSDGWILDQCRAWYGLAAAVVAEVPGVWVVDLAGGAATLRD